MCFLPNTMRAWIAAVTLPFIGVVASPPVTPTITLSNGIAMPMLMLGTPSCRKGDAECVNGTVDAITVGLPLGFAGIDTANHYNNQVGVGEGIRRSGVLRESIFVSSKVEACNNSYARLGHCAEDTRALFMQNLDELNLSYVDLMLLHSPTSTLGGDHVYPGPDFGAPSCDCKAPAACQAMQEQWQTLEGLYKEGRARAIGVSNYCLACLDCLVLGNATVTPMVNQIRLHAGMDVFSRSDSLPSACVARGIVPQAYSSLGSGASSVLHSNLTKAIGLAHGVSPAQVALRWLQDHSISSVTAVSAAHPQYMLEDLAIFNWTLTIDERARVDIATFANEDPVKNMCVEQATLGLLI